MGVKKLFEVLQPSVSNINIATLSGKTLALDLSIWELCNKNRLSYIFSRVVGILQHGIRLVVVTDGRHPYTRHATLQQRQQQSAGSSTVNADTPWWQQNRVVDILQHFGIPCIWSEGEPEALCAHLDKLGIVDGSITNDSNYLCYGGKRMYTNFHKDGKNFCVDLYSQRRLVADHHLDQDDLISLALLIGCDFYPKGVNTVGPDKGFKLLKHFRARGHNPLTRLCSWQGNKELIKAEQKLNTKINKTRHCAQCDHLGSQPGHQKNGCDICRSPIGCNKSSSQSCDCDWHQQDRLSKEYDLEIKIRREALKDTDAAFTERCQQIITEYKTRPDGVYDTQQSPFNLGGLVESARDLLELDHATVVKKMIAMVIHCQLRGVGQLTEEMFTPIRIERQSKENKVDCYKVFWDKSDRNTWMRDSPGTNLELNVECKLFARIHPAMVEKFIKENEATKKGKVLGKKRKNEPDAKAKSASKKLRFEKDQRD